MKALIPHHALKNVNQPSQLWRKPVFREGPLNRGYASEIPDFADECLSAIAHLDVPLAGLATARILDTWDDVEGILDDARRDNAPQAGRPDVGTAPGEIPTRKANWRSCTVWPRRAPTATPREDRPLNMVADLFEDGPGLRMAEGGVLRNQLDLKAVESPYGNLPPGFFRAAA